MRSTVWTIAAALSLGTGLGCHDSNQNYIGFDAQATTDAKSDATATDTKADATSDASPSDGSPADGAVEAGPADRAPDLAATDDASVDVNLTGADGADAEQG